MKINNIIKFYYKYYKIIEKVVRKFRIFNLFKYLLFTLLAIYSRVILYFSYVNRDCR